MEMAQLESDLKAAALAAPQSAEAHGRLGSFYYGAGRHEDAISAYTAALEREPTSIDYLRERALAYHALGELDKATLDVIDAIALVPRDPKLADTLGAFLQDLNRFDEAKLCHAQAIEDDPTNLNYYMNLASAMERSGNFASAEEIYRSVMSRAPDRPDAYMALSELLSRSSDLAGAAAILEEAAANGAGYPELFANLGNAYVGLGNQEAASRAYRRGLEIDPNHGYLSHMSAVVSGGKTERANPDYVAHLFDGYARNFETHLIRGLSYRVPGLLRNELIRFRPDADPGRSNAAKLRILDLGCGTGLMGVMTYDVASLLKGIDISPNMIAEARAKSIYHELVVGDLVSVMAADSSQYDVVVGGDVFCYFGDLQPVVSTARERLVPGGLLLFSVERSQGAPYQLHATGRFGHSGDYLVRTVTGAGMSLVTMRAEVIRTNANAQVSGFVVVARRPAN